MRVDEMADEEDPTVVSSNPPKEMAAATNVGALAQSGEGVPLLRQVALAADALSSDSLPEPQRSSLRLQEMIDFAPVAYIVTDAHGIIKHANHAAGELLRAARAFLLEKPLGLF